MAVKRKIIRDYRRLNPTRFLAFIQKVKDCLQNNANYPDPVWGANVALRQRFFELVEAYVSAYRLASNGDRGLIRDREKLAEEIILLLDEISSLLESASMRNPDALFTTGFSVTQERRSHHRTRLPLISSNDFTVINTGEPGKAVGTASTAPGALNHEIHINRRDPSSEADWFHKAVYPDAANMVMDNLEPGNTFFRMRHHGQEGPGPWSPITSVTIS